ncbi:MAG: RNA methyltransferase [Deltaproteobacteria bacterium]|nr:RNA methyltransferase [Deltaproteobacteria bacterium]
MDLLTRFHPVREALRARRRVLHALRVRVPDAPREVEPLRALAAAAGVRVVECSASEIGLGLPPGVKPQGYALEAGELPELALAELSALGDPGRRCVVALDGVEDPQNLGAIARVAHAAGASGLLLTDRRSAPLSPAVSRASAGAIEHLPAARVVNLSRALEQLKAAGFWVLAAEPEAPQSLFTLADKFWEGDIVVLLGAEGRGIRAGLSRQIDTPISIPMAGAVASLNVSAAAAVILYEWVRRRAEQAATS